MGWTDACEAYRDDILRLREAMRELLSGHDNLYRAHFGHLPGCDPTDDIAATAAPRILDE